MLSICIPIYNYDIRPLFYNLIKQKSTLTIPIEIVLADDGSDYSYTSINEEIASLADVYLKMDKNVGRAKIRNILSDNAQYDYLLFIDCDSVIVSDTFLSDYVAQIDGKEKVVYGGVCYSDNASWNEKLRYLYGLKRECRPVEFRNSHPYQTFLSGNFLIHKKVFEKVRFDETIVAYGYEDALFSWASDRSGNPAESRAPQSQRSPGPAGDAGRPGHSAGPLPGAPRPLPGAPDPVAVAGRVRGLAGGADSRAHRAPGGPDGCAGPATDRPGNPAESRAPQSQRSPGPAGDAGRPGRDPADQ